MYDQLIEVFNAQLPLDEHDKNLLREYFHPQQIPRKTRLIEFDRIAERFYFINRGLLRLYGYQEGEEKTLFFFRENMIAGSLESYLYQKPSELILEALEDTETLTITGKGLQSLYDASPKFSRIGLLLTQHRLARLMTFFTSFVFDAPLVRYQKFVASNPDLVQRVPQHIIASFLGVTPVSLSRIRKRISNPE